MVDQLILNEILLITRFNVTVSQLPTVDNWVIKLHRILATT